MKHLYLMTGRVLIDAGVLLQKSFKSGGGYCWRRTPSAFPLLQCLEFSGHACGNESCDCLGLAQIFDLTPGFKSKNDRSGVLLRQGCFMVLQEEPFECCSGHDLRRGTRSLPLLKKAIAATKVVVYPGYWLSYAPSNVAGRSDFSFRAIRYRCPARAPALAFTDSELAALWKKLKLWYNRCRFWKNMSKKQDIRPAEQRTLRVFLCRGLRISAWRRPTVH